MFEPINPRNTPGRILNRYPHLNGARIDSNFSLVECKMPGVGPMGICLEDPEDNPIAGVLAPNFKDWNGKADVTYNGQVIFMAARPKVETKGQISLAAVASALLILLALQCFLSKKEKPIIEAKNEELTEAVLRG
jgi:hypothetical protein